jgi:hypothetical protein
LQRRERGLETDRSMHPTRTMTKAAFRIAAALFTICLVSMVMLRLLDLRTGDEGKSWRGKDDYMLLACYGCHQQGVVGPPTQGTYARISERLSAPQNAGMTPEQYLLESIVDPRAYLVPGYQPLMPPDYAYRLTHRMVDDLVAYMMTLR